MELFNEHLVFQDHLVRSFSNKQRNWGDFNGKKL